jgi:phage terminase large subunit-like protein
VASAALKARVERLERARRTTPGAERPDPARFDWYGTGCPCGLEPGQCKEHPRARPAQRPPEGEWRTWLALAGRGFGKTRTGAGWVRWLAETGRADRIALVGPTAADARDVMIEGESGLLAVSRPDRRPLYEPSKRRVTWPNGAMATAYSADEPERLRGPQHAAAWCDELGSWRRPDAWSNLLFGLRLGDRPRVLVTTTPKPTKLIRDLVADPKTRLIKGSTYDNRLHLAPAFFEEVIAAYEGSRLGQQEIHAEVLDVSEGAWFNRFDPARHVSAEAEYMATYPVHLAIDCGVSRHVGAVWFQVRGLDPLKRRITVFADMHIEGSYSFEAANKIHKHGLALPCQGRLDTVRLDPAASARSGLGPSAYGEFERVFGARTLAKWPGHRVADGLDQLEVLLDQGLLIIHPRCADLKAAFQNYSRKQSGGGEWLDEPKDPQHPHEDLMDALRGGVRDRFPEGRAPDLNLRRIRP